jgi:hypothetical protein
LAWRMWKGPLHLRYGTGAGRNEPAGIQEETAVAREAIHVKGWGERRAAVSRRRNGPGGKQRCVVPAVYEWRHAPFARGAPDELVLATTLEDGVLSGWCTETWWNDRLSAWSHARLNVIIQPTPGAFLHSALQNLLFIVRRVAPHWRIIGQTDGAGLASRSAVDRLLNSAYDDIEFLVGERILESRANGVRSFRRILQVMRETIEVRDRRRHARPRIRWICNLDEIPAERASELEETARAFRIDGFESDHLAGRY